MLENLVRLILLGRCGFIFNSCPTCIISEHVVGACVRTPTCVVPGPTALTILVNSAVTMLNGIRTGRFYHEIVSEKIRDFGSKRRNMEIVKQLKDGNSLAQKMSFDFI